MDSLHLRAKSLLSLPALSLDSLLAKDSSLMKFSKPKVEVSDSVYKKLSLPSSGQMSDELYEKLFPTHPAFSVQGGFVNYNFSYRSNIDTPYMQSGVQQNLINAGTNFTVGQKYPMRMSVALRRTNSIYFRNYTYVNLELNTGEFRRLEAEKLRSYFNGMTGQLMDPNLKPNMLLQESRWKTILDFLNRPDIVRQFLKSKETLIHQEDLAGTMEQKDSLLKHARRFVDFYEQQQNEVKSVEKSYDSLKNVYNQESRKIVQLQQVFNKNIYSSEGSSYITQALHESDIYDSRFDKLTENLFAIKKFAIGQTIPDYTNLTVKNIGVNGINIEYNKRKLYAAVVAGMVNFEARDFILSGAKTSTQYVTAGRIGFGRKEGDHLILTVYNGKKQIFSSYTQNNTTGVFGTSLEAQWVVTKNIRVSGEIAQSALKSSPYILTDTLKNHFSLNDRSNQAWSVQMHSYFPATKTSIEGFYEYQGINFQSFNAYKVNANTNTWCLKADQFLFSNILHLSAAVQKNDYANPLVLQHYNSNTVFVTAMASFHKSGWPAFSFGYIPSSQYSIINNMTYESRYQTFTVSANHYYPIGTAKAITTLMFNRFYNSTQDTAFVYYNANNVYASENFIFTAFAANIAISHTQNQQYTLDVMDAGFSKTIRQTNSIGFGVKLNHLNAGSTSLGYYINGRATIDAVGTITVSGEKSFLPGLSDALTSTEYFNIGFIRYFK